MNRILLLPLAVLLLATLLLNLVSFSSINYAYSKELKADDKEKAKGSKALGRDSDKNKVFDELDEELQTQAEHYQKDIIALLNIPSEQVEDKVKEIKGVIGEFEVADTYSIVSGFSGKLTKKQIINLSKLDVVVQIEPDREVKAFLDTATAWFGVQKARPDFGVDGDRDGNPSTYSKDDIVIAVIDTGIHPAHLDLDSGKIIAWQDFINVSTSPYDDNGHGTHVASIAAGEGQANPAFTGVAPRAALVGVKVLNVNGSGTVSGVLSGVNWVVTNKALFGIEIMNLSLGASGCSDGTDSLSLAVNNAVNQGIIAVVAAGNDGPFTCSIGTPAAAENAITVGAMADVGEKGFFLAPFSSRGPTFDGRTKPDVVAAGVLITAAASGTTSGYATFSGTSMSSPFVAGVAALMLDANPALTPSIVKSKIKSTAVDWGPLGSEIDYGSGRLDAYEAIRNAPSPALSGTNIVVPTHTFISDSLPGTGSSDTWTIEVVDATFPIGIAMIMPTWTFQFPLPSLPDFDMFLFNPSGTLIASSEGVVTRQETIATFIPTTGTYTLQVFSFQGSGPYFLDISSGSIAAPITAGTQVTGSVTIAGTCGLAPVSGSPINYGTLTPFSISPEQTLVLDNTGSVNATLSVKGTDWLDGTNTAQMLVGNTKFSTTSGTYASKIALTTVDQVVSPISPTTNLDTFWQLQANLLSSSFAGSLTQTMDFTVSC